MSKQAFQDSYPAEFSHCYGCGRDNPHGLQLKSYWNLCAGKEHTIAYFTPKAYHTGGVPDNAYGGLIASLLDCHGTASAAAAAYKEQGRGHGHRAYSSLCHGVVVSRFFTTHTNRKQTDDSRRSYSIGR